jgi:hypothetical protein
MAVMACLGTFAQSREMPVTCVMSSRQPTRPSVFPHVSTRLILGICALAFMLRNSIYENLPKICRLD